MKYNKANNLTPVKVKDRILALDVIRGFALLGILFVNILDFSGIQFLKQRDPSIDQSALYEVVEIFFRGKFICLFSILFGIGFAMQISKFIKFGGFKRFYIRRMVVLFLFGLLHLILDPLEVLNIYAVCGVLLLFIRKIPHNIILVIALVIMALPYLQLTMSSLRDSTLSLEQNDSFISEQLKNSAPFDYEVSEIGWNLYTSDIAAAMYSKKNFLEIMTFNMDYALMRRTSSWINWLWFMAVLPYMLIGFILAKLKLFENQETYRSVFKTVVLIGLGFGILCPWINDFLITKVYTNGWSPWFSFIGALISTVSIVMTALAYGSGIMLLLQISFWRNVLSPLKYYSRMALTNYILQTIICIGLFYHFGFDLFGKLKLGSVIFMAVGIHLVLGAISSIWLKKNRYGPLEGLWRYLTYWNI
ncbi:DUF418 domain-containing protein [Aestuariivivens sediminis]|uniref:DUF418 domain-containing protein n=1 Tax=Aestuariivivens sediminis TaxID=2913557 RepID=UPI001F594C63|nr:DUF418 domain-containing protein [Aestuariivivens sediminis]